MLVSYLFLKDFRKRQIQVKDFFKALPLIYLHRYVRLVSCVWQYSVIILVVFSGCFCCITVLLKQGSLIGFFVSLSTVMFISHILFSIFSFCAILLLCFWIMKWLLGFCIPPVNILVYLWWIDFRNASCPFTFTEMATPWYRCFYQLFFTLPSVVMQRFISTICNYIHYIHRTFIMRFKLYLGGCNIQRRACHCTTLRSSTRTHESSVLLWPYLETALDSWFHVFILHIIYYYYILYILYIILYIIIIYYFTYYILYLQVDPSVWYYDINIRRTTLVHMGRSELACLSDRTTTDGRSELYGSLVSQYTVCQ